MSLRRLCAPVALAIVVGAAVPTVSDVGSVAAADPVDDVSLVLDSGGSPVAGATVTIVENPSEEEVRSLDVGASLQPEVVYTVRTDPAGEYPTPSLPDDSGDYTVVAEAPGFAPASVFVEESGVGEQRSAAATGSGGSAGIRPIHLRRSSGARRQVSGLCTISYTPIVYRKLDEASRSATVGNLFSRTGDASMSFNWSSGGSLILGVGIDQSALGKGTFTTTREINNSVNVTFSKLAAQGQRVQKTSTYYVKWQLSRTKTVVCGTTTKKVESWVEWRPEGLNGGDLGSYKIDAKPPAPQNQNYCAHLKKGNRQTVTTGRATRTDSALSVGGFTLSAQAGHSSTISVTGVAQGGPIWACGYNGPAGTDPGQLVAIPG